MTNVYTVRQVNAYIRNMFTQDFMLNRIYVKGEVSNCKYHTSGHIYFSLKDESGTIACVMFAGQRGGLSFHMRDGQQVVVFGAVSIYERAGAYQLYAKEIRLDGEGVLYEKFQMLKKELEEMGMFAPEYKQEIPAYAKTIGVVTASTGAAIRDIMNITARRNPYVQLILYPAQVQGEGAKESVVRGIHALEHYGVDLMIVGRGGGSIEDLWAFNDENLARAVYESDIPVISAVGHEPDVTIIDYVADLRAATPSNGAELAVPDQLELKQYVDQLEQRCRQAMLGQLQRVSQKLERLRTANVLTDPMAPVQNGRMRLDTAQQKLTESLRRRQHLERTRLAGLTSTLDALSPLKVLGRGYAMAQDEEGQIITSVHSVELGERITLRVSDGQLGCTVMKQFPFETREKEQNRNGSKEETL